MTFVTLLILVPVLVLVLGLLVLAVFSAPRWDGEYREPPRHRLGDFLDGGMDEYEAACRERAAREEEGDDG